jgi:hypothetical protein
MEVGIFLITMTLMACLPLLIVTGIIINKTLETRNKLLEEQNEILRKK